MHTMNGIDLSGAEYRELRDLVRLETEGGDPAGHAAKSIAGGGSSLYRSLGDKGLIEYEIADLWKWEPHFLGLTPKGRSFIEDTDAASLRDRESRRSDRRSPSSARSLAPSPARSRAVSSASLSPCSSRRASASGTRTAPS